MLKTSIRRILALVCVISLMVTNCFVLTPQVVAEAGDETPATLGSMMQEGYTVVTPETFGVPDTTGAVVDADTNETISLDKLLFGVNVKTAGSKTSLVYLQGPTGQDICKLEIVPSENRVRFYNLYDYSNKNVMYRGDSGTGSTKAYGSGSSSNYFNINPTTQFDLTTVKNAEFQIWITTEFVKAPWLPEGSAEDDLKIGLWINGTLYMYDGVGTYFYVLDCKENTYREELKTSNDKLAISSPSLRTSESTPIDFVDVESRMPEGYRVVTPLTFGVPDATTGTKVDADGNETISLDKLLFAANVGTAGTTTSLVYLQGPTGQDICKLEIVPSEDRVRFYNQYDYTNQSVMYRGDSGTGTTKAYGSSSTSHYYNIKPSQFGDLTTVKNAELQIWITTEFVKAPWLPEGSAEDDLKIGLWINGTLHTYGGVGTYFYVLDCKENTYKEELKTNNDTLTISSAFMEPNDMGMVGGEYASEAGEFYTSNLVANKIMDGTTFQTSVRFEGEGGTLYYGSNNEENAIKLTSMEEGILVTYGEKEIGLINQTNVGIDVLNHNFNLKLETELVDCDADELIDDVKLGIYVNNKYSSVDLVDAADALTASIGVKTTDGATVLVGDFASEAPEQVSWNLSDGAYTKERTDGVSRISVDGASVDGDLVLNIAGTYSVAVTENGKVYMKDVTISGDSTELPGPGGPDDPDGPEEPPVIPITPLKEPTLPQITFSDFNVSDDTYSYNNKSLATSGKYSEGVANKSFVGTVNFSTTNTSEIRIGGVKDGWEGVQLMGSGTSLKLSEAKSRFEAVTINQNDVAVPLKGNDVRFKLSIEVVNLDNDNQMDDVRFWLYFEDVLYQGKPIVEVVDYAQFLGNCLGIYSNKAASSVTIKSANLNRPKEEVDFSVMGFTKDWKQTLISTKGTGSGTNNSINRAPYTGEQSTAGIYLVMSVLSLAAVAYVLWVKRSKVSE